jgi:hypothetical protein
MITITYIPTTSTLKDMKKYIANKDELFEVKYEGNAKGVVLGIGLF